MIFVIMNSVCLQCDLSGAQTVVHVIIVVPPVGHVINMFFLCGPSDSSGLYDQFAPWDQCGPVISGDDHLSWW